MQIYKHSDRPSVNGVVLVHKTSSCWNFMAELEVFNAARAKMNAFPAWLAQLVWRRNGIIQYVCVAEEPGADPSCMTSMSYETSLSLIGWESFIPLIRQFHCRYCDKRVPSLLARRPWHERSALDSLLLQIFFIAGSERSFLPPEIYSTKHIRTV